MIEVGDYARIDKDFRSSFIGIGKVVNKNQDTIYVKMSNNTLPISFNENSITKYSKELTDLIKENDIVTLLVNGEETLNCFVDKYDIKTKFKVISDDIEILSILTKEQYEANCYKVKEE